jgi:hypothetical protein
MEQARPHRLGRLYHLLQLSSSQHPHQHRSFSLSSAFVLLQVLVQTPRKYLQLQQPFHQQQAFSPSFSTVRLSARVWARSPSRRESGGKGASGNPLSFGLLEKIGYGRNGASVKGGRSTERVGAWTT